MNLLQNLFLLCQLLKKMILTDTIPILLLTLKQLLEDSIDLL